MKNDNLGVAPFIFKRNRDYWPDMKEDMVQGFYGEDKLAYFKGRESNYFKYVEVNDGIFNDKLRKFAYEEMFKLKEEMSSHVQKLMKGGGGRGRMVVRDNSLKQSKTKKQTSFSRMEVSTSNPREV